MNWLRQYGYSVAMLIGCATSVTFAFDVPFYRGCAAGLSFFILVAASVRPFFERHQSPARPGMSNDFRH
ncbi:hypothetical protein MYSTI_01966 [Myxococcus stipitatus DSM 14675]|uniref:Lipoprotein n=1 Tax=Myxococcus stipitatus (strain DSM 14675 / JCM 12634 / Mx s8) TaxID=1278073 RepID=L7U613_MYXSD|nr:hypothetical protein [Myxococcus stipitatus]AGC43295.1 hypothetical protein MYSTI_01966 [Myxococcus stipitatus DSM 14675]